MEHYSKRINAIIWGLALLAFGICWILGALEIINFNVLFDGWWTLFIIVPCFCNLFSDKNKTGAAMGVAMGILLLLGARGIISWEQVGKLALGVIIIIAGLGLILGRILKRMWFSQKVAQEQLTIEDGKKVHNYEVSFGEQVAKLDGEVFEGEMQNAALEPCKLTSARLRLPTTPPSTSNVHLVPWKSLCPHKSR